MSPSASFSPLSAPSSPNPAFAWQADAGDGTYLNPILFADYSDPDAIRVGDDFWMTASSFSHVPGLPILHSRDLVNWRLVGHALPRLVPENHFREPRHGGGVWAPALRHHAGKFWIFYPDPDFGLYVISATDPSGSWSEPFLLKAGKGLIDPCPFWDDDGSAWMIHGWAKSRSGINNRLTLHRMAPNATRLLDDGEVVVDGDQLEGWHTLEGPKLYQRDGWYWIFAPAGGVATGFQGAFRARSIRGPYEERVVLTQGGTIVNGPHQGAWVDTPQGEHWFLHFQEHQPFGRIVHLQPMQWRDDGWPVIGRLLPDTVCGEPVLTHPEPALPPQPVNSPATSDDFTTRALGPQWQWQANPNPAWAQCDGRGQLRLACVPLSPEKNFWTAPHLLLQKFPAPAFAASVNLTLSGGEGDEAGLVVFGHDYAWLGLRHTAQGTQLVLRTCREAARGEAETELVCLPWNCSSLTLHARVDADGMVQFAWEREAGRQLIGPPFAARESAWVGAKIGLFANQRGRRAGGFAEFARFIVA